MGGVCKGMRPEGWPRILFRLAGNASLSEEALLQQPKMSTKHRVFIPARTSPGKTRPVLPAKTQTTRMVYNRATSIVESSHLTTRMVSDHATRSVESSRATRCVESSRATRSVDCGV